MYKDRGSKGKRRDESNRDRGGSGGGRERGSAGGRERGSGDRERSAGDRERSPFDRSSFGGSFDPNRNRGDRGQRDRERGSRDRGERGSEHSREEESGGEGGLLVFGRNTVVAYLEKMDLEEDENAQTVNKIYLADGSAPDDRIDKIKHLAKRLGILVVTCANAKLDMMVEGDGRHQGVVAQLSPVPLLDLNDLIELVQTDKKKREEEGLTMDGYIIVALDGVEDPRNVGAIVRSAEAQGARAVMVPERRAAGITETVAKTSAGAIAHIPIVRITNLVRGLEALKELGFWTLGLAADARDPIYKIDLVRPLVIVIGSEGKGLRPLVKENCDLMGAIPLSGQTESLNASVAAGIAMYETVRQNSAK